MFDARPHRREKRARSDDEIIPTVPAPNLARIMTVSGVTVALVAAAAMAAESYFNRAHVTFEVASDGTAQAPVYTAADATPDSDGATVGTAGLHRRIVLLEHQVARLRSELQSARNESSGFAERVVALEGRLADTEERLEAKLVVDRLDKEDAEDAADDLAAIDAPPEDPGGSTTAEDEIITGSIDPTGDVDEESTAPADLSTFATDEARAAGDQDITQTRFALGLELYDSIHALKADWSSLDQRFADVFEGLEARALHQGTESGSIRYRLVIGPVDNAAAAAELCARLQVRGVRCTQTIFGGELIEGARQAGTIYRLDVVDAATVELPYPAPVAAIIANPPMPRDKPTRS